MAPRAGAPCEGSGALFFGPALDLRTELHREEREQAAKDVCIEECPYRFSCLEFALVHNEKWGVWGGMATGDRRDFRVWLRKEGFDDIPEGDKLRFLINLYEGDDGSGSFVDRNGLGGAAKRNGHKRVAPSNSSAKPKAKARRRQRAS